MHLVIRGPIFASLPSRSHQLQNIIRPPHPSPSRKTPQDLSLGECFGHAALTILHVPTAGHSRLPPDPVVYWAPKKIDAHACSPPTQPPFGVGQPWINEWPINTQSQRPLSFRLVHELSTYARGQRGQIPRLTRPPPSATLPWFGYAQGRALTGKQG